MKDRGVRSKLKERGRWLKIDDIEKGMARSGFMLSVASWLVWGQRPEWTWNPDLFYEIPAWNHSLYQHWILTCFNKTSASKSFPPPESEHMDFWSGSINICLKIIPSTKRVNEWISELLQQVLARNHFIFIKHVILARMSFFAQTF